MYKRFENQRPLTKSEKLDLLKKYNEYYRKLIKEKGVEQLNIKIPRNVFENTLEKIGSLLLDESERLSKNVSVKSFLDENPLPDFLEGLLPGNFRVFSLLLNSLKQWVSAESAATDRYLMGGTAKDICRSVSSHCLVTNEVLDKGAELHHPMRDGRPPILLSKNGHSQIEGQKKEKNTSNDPVWDKIKALRTQRNMSWKQLAEGCNTLLGKIPESDCRPGAKSFANVVIKETQLGVKEILKLLNKYGVL
ncbi:MAG: hypothetical protein LBQ93_09665 [Treponema sp.]|jgi:hypothetical protein|nr:hypothetical protein [Treponema sp.]